VPRRPGRETAGQFWPHFGCPDRGASTPDGSGVTPFNGKPGTWGRIDKRGDIKEKFLRPFGRARQAWADQRSGGAGGSGGRPAVTRPSGQRARAPGGGGGRSGEKPEAGEFSRQATRLIFGRGGGFQRPIYVFEGAPPPPVIGRTGPPAGFPAGRGPPWGRQLRAKRRAGQKSHVPRQSVISRKGRQSVSLQGGFPSGFPQGPPVGGQIPDSPEIRNPQSTIRKWPAGAPDFVKPRTRSCRIRAKPRWPGAGGTSETRGRFGGQKKPL